MLYQQQMSPRLDSDVTQRSTEKSQHCSDRGEEMEDSQITSNEDNVI